MTTDDLAQATVDLAVTDGNDEALERLRAQLDAEDDARRARLGTTGALADAAAWYAANSIPVFPLVPGEKRPIVRRGLHEATTDPAQVAGWWRQWPQANIGLRTGVLFDVIDVDGPPGYLALADLLDQGALPPVLGRVSTARGAHLYVPVSGRGNKAGLLEGIDYRGDGGYVVAPPSLSRETGRRWAWHTPLDLDTLTAAA